MATARPSLASIALFSCILCNLSSYAWSEYTLDIGGGLGRHFDGIGGLSGGGATSKLLVNYPEPQKSQILDYLFKPNFGASLDILKVEIGGDSQSTDGTESSHMHTENDESYDRGYEWWLMVEAKLRNPDIKLYALPWAFPGWVGEGTQNPYTNPSKTAKYILRWVLGAKTHYNLTIDYVGIWNERPYTLDYIVTLRRALDAANFTNVRIVGVDNNLHGTKGFLTSVLSNSTVASAVDIIGVHYPGTNSSPDAIKTNKALWSSEDYSTNNGNQGAGCWARILNQNYVNGHMTSTISWTIIASWYDALPWKRSGLMTAIEPWSGNYIVAAPIWISAHTTQFTSVGWHYLHHGSGVGKLEHGGSFVSLISPDKQDLTIILETMQRNHSRCVRPRLPEYTVKAQNATFVLKPSLQHITVLNVWSSKLGFKGDPTTLFVQRNPVKIIDGRFTLLVLPDEVHTLSTINGGNKGQYPASPPSKPFPLPYADDFEHYSLNSESYNFVPQIGVWEVRKGTGKDNNQVDMQVVTDQPVDWCKNPPIHNLTNSITINVGGNFAWSDITISMDLFLPVTHVAASGVYIAVRVHMNHGSCQMLDTPGIYFAMYPYTSPSSPGLVTLSKDMLLKDIDNKAQHSVPRGQWFNMKLAVKGNTVQTYLDGGLVIQSTLDNLASNGFAAYGTSSFGEALFDNLLIDST